MAAAGKWQRYDKFPLHIGDGIMNLTSDTIKCLLVTNTSNAATTTLDVKASLTAEHANQGAPGYETGGKTVAATYTEASGTITFDVADAAWTATGGSIVCRWAVLYDDTPAGGTVDPLIAFCLLDTAPADVTVTVGNGLTIVMNASGVLTLSGGQVQ